MRVAQPKTEINTTLATLWRAFEEASRRYAESPEHCEERWRELQVLLTDASGGVEPSPGGGFAVLISMRS